ncbi:unnamed protein product [Brassicogethes aeneus]|uniref:FHA domain-containing protein n=1 Tax=Brassicogethes aeneus TaxID=1431903 RepID=A0A9P0B5T6_BRAAE|nr:unnamed protein product [Brassicogethes aeneus]
MEGDEECGFLQFFRKNGELGSPYPLSYGKTTIGSFKDADIRLKINDSRLEQIHCVINVYSEGLATLVNKSQNNPTKVNDEIVTQFKVLNHKDKFEIVGKYFQYFNEHVNKKNVAKLEKTLTKAISPSKTNQSMFSISTAESEPIHTMDFEKAPENEFTVTFTPERKPDTKNVSSTKAKTTSKVVVSKALHASPDKTQRRLSLGHSIKRSGTTPKISSRNVLLNSDVKTPLKTRASLKNDRSSIKRSLLKRYSSTPKIATPETKKTPNLKFSPIASTSCNTNSTYCTPNSRTYSPIQLGSLFDSVKNESAKKLDYSSSKFLTRRSASLRNEIVKNDEDESIIASLKAPESDNLQDSNDSLGLDLDAIPNMSKVDVLSTTKSKTPLRTPKGSSLRKKALQNLANADMELYTDRELNMIQKKLENEEDMMSETPDSVFSVSSAISTPENNMSVVFVSPSEASSPMTRRSKKLLASSIIELDDTGTPKSAIKSLKITEEGPRTPEQKPAGDKGFKTPLTTPHVFEKIRKSAIKSRLKSNAEEYAETSTSAHHGLKRNRESTGSMSRSTKKLKLQFKSFSDEDSFSDFNTLDSSVTSEDLADLNLTEQSTPSGNSLAMISLELSSIIGEEANRKSRRQSELPAETPKNNPDEYSTSRRSVRFSFVNDSPVKEITNTSSRKSSRRSRVTSEDSFVVTDRNVSMMSFKEQGEEPVTPDNNTDITLSLSRRNTYNIDAEDSARDADTRKSCRRSELDMLLNADQLTISNLSASRRSGKQSLVLSEDDFSDTSSNTSKIHSKVDDLEESDSEKLSPRKSMESSQQDNISAVSDNEENKSARRSNRYRKSFGNTEQDQSISEENNKTNIENTEANTSTKSTNESISLDDSIAKPLLSRRSVRKSETKDTLNEENIEVNTSLKSTSRSKINNSALSNDSTSNLSITTRRSARKSEIKDDNITGGLEESYFEKISPRKRISVLETSQQVGNISAFSDKEENKSARRSNRYRKSFGNTEQDQSISEENNKSNIENTEANTSTKSTNESISLDDSIAKPLLSRRSVRKSETKDTLNEENIEVNTSLKSTSRSKFNNSALSNDSTSNLSITTRRSARKSEIKDDNITGGLEESYFEKISPRKSINVLESSQHEADNISAFSDNEENKSTRRSNKYRKSFGNTKQDQSIYEENNKSKIENTEANTSTKSTNESISLDDSIAKPLLSRRSVRKSETKDTLNEENIEVNTSLKSTSRSKINNSALSNDSTSNLSITTTRSARKSEIKDDNITGDLEESDSDNEENKSTRRSNRYRKSFENTQQDQSISEENNKSKMQNTEANTSTNNTISLDESLAKPSLSRRSVRKSETKDTLNEENIEVNTSLKSPSRSKFNNSALSNHSTYNISITTRRSARKSEMKDDNMTGGLEESDSKKLSPRKSISILESSQQVGNISDNEENKSTRKSNRYRKSFGNTEQDHSISEENNKSKMENTEANTSTNSTNDSISLDDSIAKPSLSRRSVRNSEIKDTLNEENIEVNTSLKSTSHSKISNSALSNDSIFNLSITTRRSARKSEMKDDNIENTEANTSTKSTNESISLDDSIAKPLLSRRSVRKSETKDTLNEENIEVNTSLKSTSQSKINNSALSNDSTSNLSLTTRRSARKSEIKDHNITGGLEESYFEKLSPRKRISVLESSQQVGNISAFSDQEENKSTRRSNRYRNSFGNTEQDQSISEKNNKSKMENAEANTSTKSTNDSILLDDSIAKPSLSRSVRNSEIKDTLNEENIEALLNDSTSNLSITTRRSARKSQIKDDMTGELEESDSPKNSISVLESSQVGNILAFSDNEVNKSTRRSNKYKKSFGNTVQEQSVSEQNHNSEIEYTESNTSARGTNISKTNDPILLGDVTAKPSLSRRSARKSEIKDALNEENVELNTSLKSTNISAVLNDSTINLLSARRSTRQSKIKDTSNEENIANNDSITNSTINLSSTRRSTRKSDIKEENVIVPSRKSKSEIKDSLAEELIQNMSSNFNKDIDESSDLEVYSAATPNNSVQISTLSEVQVEHNYSVLADISNSTDQITRKSPRKSIASAEIDDSKEQSRAKSASFVDLEPNSSTRNSESQISIVLELSQSELQNISALLEKETDKSHNVSSRKSIRSSFANRSLANEQNKETVLNASNSFNTSARKSLRKSSINEAEIVVQESSPFVNEDALPESLSKSPRKSTRLSKSNGSVENEQEISPSFTLHLSSSDFGNVSTRSTKSKTTATASADNTFNNTMDDNEIAQLSLENENVISPVSIKGSKSPKNDLTEIYGVKKLMQTPKAVNPPKNDLSNVIGVKKLMQTPKALNPPKNDLSNVTGVKKLMQTPKTVNPPKNDLSNVIGVKKLMQTPKAVNSPKNDLSNVAGVKSLLRTPRVIRSPKNDLSDVQGVKTLLHTPKVQNSPKNDLSDVKGVKILMKTPRVTKDPKNDLSDVEGVKILMKTPRVTKDPKNDLSDVEGVKILMKTPRVTKDPKNDLSDVEGVEQLFDISGVQVLSDCETNDEAFDKLSEKKKRKTYSRSLSPKKSQDDSVFEETIPPVDPKVENWITDQQKTTVAVASKNKTVKANIVVPLIQLNNDTISKFVKSPPKKKPRGRKLMSDEDIKEPQNDIIYSEHKSEKPVVPLKTRKSKQEPLDSIIASALEKPNRLSRTRLEDILDKIDNQVQKPKKAEQSPVKTKQGDSEQKQVQTKKPAKNARRKIGEAGLEPVETKAPEKDKRSLSKTRNAEAAPVKFSEENPSEEEETPIKSGRGKMVANIVDEKAKPCPRKTTRNAKATPSEESNQEEALKKTTRGKRKVAEKPEEDKPSPKVTRGKKVQTKETDNYIEQPLEETPVKTKRGRKIANIGDEEEKPSPRKTIRNAKKTPQPTEESEEQETPIETKRGKRVANIVDEEVKPSSRKTTRNDKKIPQLSEEEETPIRSTRGRKIANIVDEEVKPSPRKTTRNDKKSPQPSEEEETPIRSTRGKKIANIVDEEVKPSPRKTTRNAKKTPQPTEESEEQETPIKTKRGKRVANIVDEEVKPSPRKMARNAKKSPQPSEEQETSIRSTRGKKIANIVDEEFKPSPRKTTRNAKKSPQPTEESNDKEEEAPKKTARGRTKVAENPEEDKPSPKKVTRGKKVQKEETDNNVVEPIKSTRGTRTAKSQETVEEQTKRTTRGKKAKESEETEKEHLEPSPKKTTRGKKAKGTEKSEVIEEQPESSPKKTTRGRKAKESEEIKHTARKTRGKTAAAVEKEEKDECQELETSKRGKKIVEEDAPTPKRNRRGVKTVHFEEEASLVSNKRKSSDLPVEPVRKSKRTKK